MDMNIAAAAPTAERPTGELEKRLAESASLISDLQEAVAALYHRLAPVVSSDISLFQQLEPEAPREAPMSPLVQRTIANNAQILSVTSTIRAIRDVVDA